MATHYASKNARMAEALGPHWRKRVDGTVRVLNEMRQAGMINVATEVLDLTLKLNQTLTGDNAPWPDDPA